ncbi:MAG: type IV pilus modification PilV family protein [Candidatus Muiribacteriota bacterium]
MNKKGFTVTEIMIALFFFALVVIPYAAHLVNSTRNIQKISNYNVAILLVQEALEACKSYHFELLDKDDSGDLGFDEEFFLESAFQTGVRPGTDDTSDYDGPADISDLNVADDDDDLYWRAAKIQGVWYTRDVEINEVKPRGESIEKVNLKSVHVTVTWKSGTKNISYSASTVIGR